MTNNPLANLSVQQLKDAIQIREMIEALQQDLDQVLGAVPAELPTSAPSAKISQRRGSGKRFVSAESRAKMAAAQLARRMRENKALSQTSAPANAKPTVKPDAKAKVQTQAETTKTFGHLKESIIELLKAAGQKGLTLKEICGKLGLSQSHLNTWMHATGRKIKGVKKIGRGIYAWKG